MNRNNDLEMRFHSEMALIYKNAKRECNYNATRFLQMLSEHGGLQTARILLHAPNISDGFAELWKRNRLDLTVEALVLKAPWKNLFSDEEINIAKKRLDERTSF